MSASTQSTNGVQPKGPGMDAEQMAGFIRELKANLEAGDQVENAIEMAEYDSRFEGLEHLRGFEIELRKLDLAQIGYIILSTIGELNHGSWDGFDREELKRFNWVFGEFIQTFQHWEPHGGSYKEGNWGFGGVEHWDEQGVRHTREAK